MTTTQIPSDVKRLILAGLLPIMSDIISELINDKHIGHNQVKTGNNLVKAIDPFVNEMLKGVCVQSADEQLGIQSWFMGVLRQQIDEALNKEIENDLIEDKRIVSLAIKDRKEIMNKHLGSLSRHDVNDILNSWTDNPPIQPITDYQKDCIIKYSSKQMNDLFSEDMMDDLLP